jgi:hypothetical protein
VRRKSAKVSAPKRQTAAAPVPQKKPTHFNRDEYAELSGRVFELRILNGFSYTQIKESLAKSKPPIHISRWQVERFIQYEQLKHRRTFTRAKRDRIVVNAAARYEHIYRQATRQYHVAVEVRDKLSALREMRDAVTSYVQFFQSIGIVDKTLGTLILGFDGAIKDEKIPDGSILRKWFEGIEVTEGEVVSDAERAIRYGEHAALPPAHGGVRVDDGSGDGS